MAAGLYRLNTQVVLTPGAFTADATTGLRFGTGSNANAANNWGSGASTPVVPADNANPFTSVGPQGSVVKAGQLIWVDPAAALGVALGGAGNLTAVTPGQETGGFYGTAN
jgi:hypothetical protein